MVEYTDSATNVAVSSVYKPHLSLLGNLHLYIKYFKKIEKNKRSPFQSYANTEKYSPYKRFRSEITLTYNTVQKEVLVFLFNCFRNIFE